MNPIEDNPYRTLGLFANCTEREIARQVAKLSRYAEIGKSVEFRPDMPILGGINRDSSAITDAAARLQQPSKKLHWAMFWFINVNHIDETAFGHLEQGNVEKAGKIWSLALKDKPITDKNFSALANLSTLKLWLVIQDEKLNVHALTSAIQLKGKLIAADAFNPLVDLVVCGSSHSVREAASKEFVAEILRVLKPHTNKRGGISSEQLVSSFGTFPADVRTELAGRFTAGPIRRIETALSTANKARVDDPGRADEAGIGLYESTQDDLENIKAVIGFDAVQYQSLVNKVAQEILQCSIDYFNEYASDYDSDYLDPGPSAMGLLELVRLLEPTGEVKHRLEENSTTIEAWVDDTQARDQHLKVKGDLEFIKNAIDGFQPLRNNPTTALSLLQACQPKLEHMAFVLGRENELYLTMSDAVAGNAVGMTIAAINSAQERALPLSTGPGFLTNMGGAPDGLSSAESLRNQLKEGSKVMVLLAQFDLSPELRQRCEANGRVLLSIMGQLGMRVAATTPRPAPTGGRKDTAEKRFQTPPHRGPMQHIAFTMGKRPGVALGAGMVVLLIVIAAISDMTGVTQRLTTNSNANRITPTQLPPNMVIVPETTFRMGRSKGGSAAEGPAHTVTVKSFYIDVNEVTNADYQEFIKATKRPPPGSWKGPYNESDLGKYPVVGVSYADAEAYAKWAGKRLPTEQEWELAARGTDGRIYPWGNDWRTGYANADPRYRDLAPVDNYPLPSPLGLYNVIGNAWEWTSSDFKPYPGGRLPNEYVGKKNLKTLRGGNFSTPKEYATTTYRIGWPATGAENYDVTGFRCAKDGPR